MLVLQCFIVCEIDDIALSRRDGGPGLGLHTHVVQVLVKALLWRIFNDRCIDTLLSLIVVERGVAGVTHFVACIGPLAFQGRNI